MKTRLFLLLCALTAPLTGFSENPAEAQLEAIGTRRSDAISQANNISRLATADVIPLGDRVSVFLLDFEPGLYRKDAKLKEGPKIKFSEHDVTTILDSKDVPFEQVSAWTAAIRKMVGSTTDGGGAFCHFPIHGLAVYSKDELIFETTICWKCNNYLFHFPGKQPSRLLPTDRRFEVFGNIAPGLHASSKE